MERKRKQSRNGQFRITCRACNGKGEAWVCCGIYFSILSGIPDVLDKPCSYCDGLGTLRVNFFEWLLHKYSNFTIHAIRQDGWKNLLKEALLS